MQWLKDLWSPRDLSKAALASIGGLCVAVGGNAIYGAFAGLGWGNVGIAIGSLLLAGLFFKILIPMLLRSPRFKAGQLIKSVPPRQALITAVSVKGRGENVARRAIRHHLGDDSGGAAAGRLKLCWLLYTHDADPQTDPDTTSEAEAARLRDEYPSLIRLVELGDDADRNPKEMYRKVLSAYWAAIDAGIPHDEVIADVTAGTKAMSIGMDLACRELNLSMECIASKYKNGRPISGTERFVAIDTTGIGVPVSEAAAVEASVAADGVVPAGEGVVSRGAGDGDGNIDAAADR